MILLKYNKNHLETASQGLLLRHLTSTSMGRGHVFEEHDVDSSSLSWSALRSGNLLN